MPLFLHIPILLLHKTCVRLHRYFSHFLQKNTQLCMIILPSSPSMQSVRHMAIPHHSILCSFKLMSLGQPTCPTVCYHSLPLSQSSHIPRFATEACYCRPMLSHCLQNLCIYCQTMFSTREGASVCILFL